MAEEARPQRISFADGGASGKGICFVTDRDVDAMFEGGEVFAYSGHWSPPFGPFVGQWFKVPKWPYRESGFFFDDEWVPVSEIEDTLRASAELRQMLEDHGFKIVLIELPPRPDGDDFDGRSVHK